MLKEESSIQDFLYNEIKILKTINHPNIIEIYDIMEDYENLYIITELCLGGELLQSIKSKGRLNEHESAIILKQILSCLSLCHRNKIVHRDIKPENIMVFSNEDPLTIKIVDWGTAKIIKEGINLSSILGTPMYMAPEILSRNYNEKCDIWSCGVLLYELISGKAPFEGDTRIKILGNVFKGNYNFSDPIWNSISHEAKELIRAMMNMSPQLRPSAEKLLQNKWILIHSNELFNPSKLFIDNLKSYSYDKFLFEELISLIAPHFLSPKEKIDLMKTFNKLDLNNDGNITKEEFSNYFKNTNKENVSPNKIVIFKAGSNI